MLFQLSVIPLGTGTHLSDEIARVLQEVDASGLPYDLTPAGTCIEGEWDEVMPLIQRCHELIRSRTSHVITTIKIEDQAGAENQLIDNVAIVERKVGKTLQRLTVE